MNQGKKTNSIDDNIGEKYFDLIRKSVFWEEYTYDAQQKAIDKGIRSKMKVLDSPVKVQIPSKENIRYLHIKNFEDHDLSNNLALDMIVRNKEFQNYMYYTAIIDDEFEMKPLELKEKHYKRLQSEMIDKFGFDIKEKINLIAHHPFINEKITNYLDNVANESLILNPPFINDIKNGLRRVIDFYLEKKKLYILIPSDYEKIENINLENTDSKEKLYVKIINPNNLKNDYILLSVYEEYKNKFNRVNNLFYKLPLPEEHLMSEIDDEIIENYLYLLCIPITTFGKEKLVSLKEHLFPVEFLDEEFKSSLKGDDFIDFSMQDSKYKTILPSLKFASSKSINITINPDLPLAEQMAKMTKLHINTKNIKSFIETLNKKIENIIKIKNSKYMSKKTKLRNRDYSNAFYIYDLYKIISREFHQKILELEQEAEKKKKRIEKNLDYSKEAKKHEYNKIEEKLKNNLSLFSKTVIDNEIQKITTIEISKLRGLHSLMQEYIDESKFKNVILGQ